MFTRISSAAALILLAGCGSGSADTPSAPARPTEAIECALAGAASFARTCTVERVAAKEGLQLVVRHPDGGFRRFDVVTDGRGLVTADGAQPAVVAVRPGGIEVTVGADRYRFPATVVPHDGG